MFELTRIYNPLARLEFIQATEYCRNISPDLKQAFKNAFVEALEEITQFPEAWSKIARTPARGKQISGYPYTIIYLLEPDAVYIVAIVHQRREPLYWLDRLREPGRE